MIYLFQLFLVAGNIWMAYFHSTLIKAEKKIQHGLWGAAYLAVAVWLSLWLHSWVLFALSLFIRKVFFDLPLSLFRGLPLFYVSTVTTSIIDKMHYRIFGKRSEIYMGIYLLLIVTGNVLIAKGVL